MHHALTLACAPWQESTGASVLETLKSGSCLSFPSPPPARLCPAEGSSLPATQLQDQSRHHPKASLPPWLAGCLPLVMQVPGGQAQPPQPRSSSRALLPALLLQQKLGISRLPKGKRPLAGNEEKELLTCCNQVRKSSSSAGERQAEVGAQAPQSHSCSPVCSPDLAREGHSRQADAQCSSSLDGAGVLSPRSTVHANRSWLSLRDVSPPPPKRSSPCARSCPACSPPFPHPTGRWRR